MIVDSAIYVHGKRVESPGPFSETYEDCRAKHGIAWIGLLKPTKEEFDAVAAEFGLHELAVEDALLAHQRPKLERYGETLFVVLKAARYLDAQETVEFAELHIFVGPDFVITVRHGNMPDLGRVRRRMEGEPDLLDRGPDAILYAILDRVVDDYGPVIAGLEHDIDQIETEVFGGNASVTRRTYELAREVIEFQRAIKPLTGILAGLMNRRSMSGAAGAALEDDEQHRYLRDVQDHAIQVQEQAMAFRELLQNILSVNLAIVGLHQNEEVKALSEASIAQNDDVKLISAWAAILFAPTLIGTIYGMNFEHMPEESWVLGYPFALGLMVVTSIALYAVFRGRGWLG